jgi:hypothetical protein
MTQILYAKNLTLAILREKFGVHRASQLLTISESELPGLSAAEIQALERIQNHYLNLSEYGQASEETVKLVIVSRLLDLAGFYDAPYCLETETSIELETMDEEIIVRGAIDILVIQQQLWILMIESKRLGFDVMVALPQALAHMLDAPNHEKPLFGLLTNGREFIFVQLTRQPQPEYSLSQPFSLYPANQLDTVLKWLKYLGQAIAPQK